MSNTIQFKTQKVQVELRKFDKPVQGFYGVVIITSGAESMPINLHDEDLEKLKNKIYKQSEKENEDMFIDMLTIRFNTKYKVK